MATFTPEELEALRRSIRTRADEIARRKREVDVMRRALWLRMEVVREHCARPLWSLPGGEPEIRSAADFVPAPLAPDLVTVPASTLAPAAPPATDTRALAAEAGVLVLQEAILRLRVDALMAVAGAGPLARAG